MIVYKICYRKRGILILIGGWKRKRMKKVSLIIPIYNAQEYLKECLESAVAQTYKNMEIICIDDGSTDGSGGILDSFADRYDNIVAVHQSNKGESAARNVGLSIASGDYIAFMDCDDWIESHMYETLVNMIEKNNVDMAASSWTKEFPTYTAEMKNSEDIVPGVIGQEELMYYVYRRDAYQGFAYMWNKLYRRSVIYGNGENPLMFSEDLRLGGDVLYLARILLNTKSAVYTPENFYHYRQRKVSGCHTDDIEKRMDWLKAYEVVIDLFEHTEVKEEILIWVKRFLAYHSSNVAELSFQQGNRSALVRCQEIMRQYGNDYRITNEMYPDRVARYNKILEYQ